MRRYYYTGAWLILFMVVPACLTAQPVQSIKAWTKSEKVRTYSPQTLWDYIDGAADYFLTYNFSNLEVSEYYRSDEEYIKVEIYDHRDPLNAFGIYAYERPPEVEYLNLGAEAYRVYSALNFYCDHYYVKIMSHQSDENTLETILKLATEVAERLASKEQEPLLTLLPKEDRVPHTEKFFPENFLGYSFMIQAIEAAYQSGEESYKLFVIEQSGREGARKILDAYLNFAGVDTLVQEGTAISLEDMFHGRVYLMIHGNCLYGIYDAESEDLALGVLGKL
jgi:hypothetical protein